MSFHLSCFLFIFLFSIQSQPKCYHGSADGPFDANFGDKT